MSAYAPTPGFAQKHHHPRALLLIVGGHAALIAAVMVVKMDLPSRFISPPTDVTFVPLPPPPEPAPLPPEPRASAQPADSAIDRMPVIVPIPSNDGPLVDRPIVSPPLGEPVVGPGVVPSLQPPLPIPDPVRTGPRFVTPAAMVEPPFPESKRERGEEAVLRLRLAIDERGRVTSVAPVGSADRTFLAAARRHILAHWRYQPAREGERAVASSTVVTLQFRLDD